MYLASFFLTLPFLAAVEAGPTPHGKYIAEVNSKCPFPVYVESLAYYNGPSNGITKIGKGGATSYAEYQKPNGTYLKLGIHESLGKPLTFQISGADPRNKIFYDLADQYGNPFDDYRNIVEPSRSKCDEINCAPHATDCYANDGFINVKKCTATTLSLTLCANAK